MSDHFVDVNKMIGMPRVASKGVVAPCLLLPPKPLSERVE